MPRTFRLLTLIFALSVASCASTGVIPVGEDLYYIGKKDGTPGLGVDLENKAEVYKEANSFCEQKGLSLEVVEENITPAAPARLGSTELKFKCV